MSKRGRRSHTVTRTHLIHTRTHDDDDELQTPTSSNLKGSVGFWPISWSLGESRKSNVEFLRRRAPLTSLFSAAHRAQGTPPWVERSGTNDAQTSPFSPWMPLEAHF